MTTQVQFRQLFTDTVDSFATGYTSAKYPDVAADDCLRAFGAKNLEEYLANLSDEHGINLLEQRQVAAAKRKTAPLLQDQKFFHYFLQEFLKVRAKAAQDFERQRAIAIDVSAKVAKEPLPGLNGKRYEEDIAGTVKVGDADTSYSETIGYRPTQEDAFIIGAASSEFSDTTKCPALLRKKFIELGEKIAALSGELSGSTASVAHYSADQKLTIATAGDARPVLVKKVKQADGKFKVSIDRLGNDHDAGEVFEEARVKALGGYVYDDHGHKRVAAYHGGGLMIARSFGDNYYKGDQDKRLIAFEPDVIQHDIGKMIERDRVAHIESEYFLINSCDGLYDHDKGNEATYAAALENWFNNDDIQLRWSGNISEYLRDCAITLGSEDNVTVAVTNLTNPPTKGIVTGIFDGHGGNAVSRTLALEFEKSLLNPKEKKVVHAIAGKSLLSDAVMAPVVHAKSRDSKMIKHAAAAYLRLDYKRQLALNTKLDLGDLAAGQTTKAYIRSKLEKADTLSEDHEIKYFLSDDGINIAAVNPRGHHGVVHSTLTATYAGMFADFYAKYFPATALTAEQKDLAMFLTSLHDVARTHGGVDHNEYRNAVYIALVLEKKYGLNRDAAIELADHVSRKDDLSMAGKSIYSKITQSADCASIIRCLGSSTKFNFENLNAFLDVQTLKDPEKSAAQKELEQMLNLVAFVETETRKELLPAKSQSFDRCTAYLAEKVGQYSADYDFKRWNYPTGAERKSALGEFKAEVLASFQNNLAVLSHITVPPLKALQEAAGKTKPAIDPKIGTIVTPKPSTFVMPTYVYKPYVKAVLIANYIDEVKKTEGVASVKSRSQLKLAILLAAGNTKNDIIKSAFSKQAGDKIIIAPKDISEELKKLNFSEDHIKKAIEIFKGGISINKGDISVLCFDRAALPVKGDGSREFDKEVILEALTQLVTPALDDAKREYFDNTFGKIQKRMEELSKAKNSDEMKAAIGCTKVTVTR